LYPGKQAGYNAAGGAFKSIGGTETMLIDFQTPEVPDAM